MHCYYSSNIAVYGGTTNGLDEAGHTANTMLITEMPVGFQGRKLHLIRSNLIGGRAKGKALTKFKIFIAHS